MNVTSTRTNAFEFRYADDDGAVFETAKVDDDGNRIIWSRLELDPNRWSNLGEPRVITVTIESGDTLNPAS